MKIVVAEERNQTLLNERAFVREIVRVGRNPESCEIVFEQKTFPMVSRHHAELREQNGKCFLVDLNSSFGTFLNGRRVTQPIEIGRGATLRFGENGPLLRVQSIEFQQTAKPAAGAPIKQPQPTPAVAQFDSQPATLLGANVDFSQANSPKNDAQPSQLLRQIAFNGKPELTVGRGGANDIKLDGLQISKQHARFVKTQNGIFIEDSNSTNGVYYAGKRIAGRQTLTDADTVQIGAFQLRASSQGVQVFDTRSKTEIDALHVTKIVKDRSGGGEIKLLDDVSLTIQPNEFVGLLGPSGAGKSTLMDALNGMRPPTNGNVFINNLDFYQNLDALKQNIGYVPQDDIIHRELTVYKTLYYIAKLRLSGDVTNKETEEIISEVLDVTGLTERRDVPIADLSGGQRKRVSIAVELITKPSVIFLDEPTSGLDPATEDKIMKLFRRIAESGRTVILTTHAMENVRLFDKIVVLMRGKLAFYGTPSEALKHIGARDFKELYDKLEEPIEQKIAERTQSDASALKKQRNQVTEQVAEDWKQSFQRTDEFRRNVYEPLDKLVKDAQTNKKPRPPKRRLGIFGAIRQTATLTNRYAAVLLKDRFNLAILLLQSPVIAIMILLVMTATQPRDFIYFVLSLVAVWFGTSVAAREIVRERQVYKRERMVNLGLLPYIGSKLIVLGFIVALQCLLLFVPLKIFDAVGLMRMPGEMFNLPQLFVMLLTAFVGIALGLLISALVKTSEMATSLVPLILIPQILFSGLVGVPKNAARIASLTMPAAWSFDAMKRYSGLDTLEKEGSDLNGANKGSGLYKAVESRNDDLIEQTKTDIDDYKRKMKNYLADVQQGLKSTEPLAPQIKPAEKIPENLSNYVGFLHPWMRENLNEAVLFVMFIGLLLATVTALRSQDIR